ncbi:phosphatidylinositol N-acetylglucosaminyltransferas-like protein subunit C [Lophiotrema nucula]|uniref:Phosphatidylinositol N-acetylglucosaminyltransferas-like protein subunit C n=1 Tax=Lophiotrema nucula TaxID=690887 RepID=A0A6A5YGX1_9PLEO|nr:phosphatidylinositol N-acetylglucosaminyltransferas-like protein subunit C [Lophiotrema nucula]
MPSTSSGLITAHSSASSPAPNPDRLAPDDAYYETTPRRAREQSLLGLGADGVGLSARKRKEKDRTRSASRRRKGHYKKLLWFKQPFPDNYTDEETFLDHMKRNPRLQPYEFWSLMADATVIVQHIASVAIFCCCFVDIAQARVSPVSVVSWASLCTVLGWVLWDYWMAQEEADIVSAATKADEDTASRSSDSSQRLATAKSALLIYAALLGLSPILKSLTKSTTSDSIWAISTWLLCMNVAFFDYGGGTGSHLPASISTNSALMASTVLASRLPSTTHVFSLTLFSIEVFGLFPIFRRHLRSMSWVGHMTLTIALIISACGGVSVTLTGGGRGAWVGGVVLGGCVTFLAMGICSWWLIGLQKYKNEIHGPWDPARPIIRRRWD